MISISIPLFISGAEIFFIIFIVVMVFGADKVPEIARGLGKGMRQIKDATNDIKGEIIKSADKEGVNFNVHKNKITDFTDDISGKFKDITKNISTEADKIKEDVDKVTGPIKRKF